MMSKIAEQVAKDCPEVPDSRGLAKPVNDFLFRWEKEGSAESPTAIEEDEGSSEPRTPVSEPPRQPSALEARPALHSLAARPLI